MNFEDDAPDEQINSILGEILNIAGNPTQEDELFFKNILDEIPDDIQYLIGNRLKKLYESDLEANQDRLEIISRGLEELGLTQVNSNNGDGDKFKNSAFLSSWLALCAESSSELFPPNNIVSVSLLEDFKKLHKNKTQNQTNLPPEVQAQQDMLDQEKKKNEAVRLSNLYKISAMAEDDINNMFCEQYPDMIEEMEKAINNAFIAGSCVVKVYHDPSLGRPYIRMIPPERISANPEATNLASATRVSHSFILTEKELRDYVYSGYFSKKNLRNLSDNYDDDNPVTEVRDSIEGIDKDYTANTYLDYTYEFVEMEIFLSLNEIGDKEANSYDTKESWRFQLMPYSITFEASTGNLVRVVRKWNKNSPKNKKLQNLVQFKFLTGFGLWGQGLAHLAVTMARAATILEQELVRSARLSNFPGGIMRADAQIDNSNLQLNNATYFKVRTSDPISEIFEKLPFTPPSPMLKEILGDIERKIQQISGITALKMENIPSNIKSSALLAILEKEIKPQSAVMRRIQASVNQVLKIIHRILIDEMGNEEFGIRDEIFLDDIYQENIGLTNKEVYGAPIIIRSSADPSLTNSAAQMIRAQYIHELAASDPTQHKMNEVYRRLYQIMRVPDIDGILYTPEEMQKIQEQQAQAQAQALDQNKILMADVEQKAKAAEQKNQVEMMKVQNKAQIDMSKLDIERESKAQEFQYQMIKEQEKRDAEELKAHINIEKNIRDNLNTENDLLIKKAKTESEIGHFIQQKTL